MNFRLFQPNVKRFECACEIFALAKRTCAFQIRQANLKEGMPMDNKLQQESAQGTGRSAGNPAKREA
jgi:hypothetical protein